MPDPLSQYMRPGFPKEFVNDSGYETIVEYIGQKDDLYGEIELGAPWGGYQGIVEELRGDPVEGSSGYVTLEARIVRRFDASQPGVGPVEEMEVNYELEWIAVSKPLIQHDQYQPGGTKALTPADITKINKWEEMPDSTLKAQYKFYSKDYADWDGTTTETLTGNAKHYAYGKLIGIDTFDLFAPVIRKSITYKNGLPSVAKDAGEKDQPDFGVNTQPSGYEWIKTADSFQKTGKQNEWVRNEEWLGSDKVWVDSRNLYWDTPA